MARAIVPCGSCSACCRIPIVLFPEHGDDPAAYEHDTIHHPGLGKSVAVLKHSGGACVYLKDSRCSIWERAPHACRAFDCRRYVLMFDAPGLAASAVVQAGRDRLDTLTPADG